jgi:replication factor C subunit 1
MGKLIRTDNNWSLLTTQSIFTTVVPGFKLSGGIGLPAFPSWFGKNSKQSRVDRLMQELQKHMRLHISANKRGLVLDYLHVLKKELSVPLIKKGADGIAKLIEFMDMYCITRDDFDTIMEVSTWPGQKDPMSLIDSKVKAAFTRTYNKESHMNPFSVVNVKKLKAIKQNDENLEDENEMEIDEENENEKEDVNSDAMIKINVKKKPIKAAAAVKRSAPNASDSVDSSLKPTENKKKKK